VIPAPAKPHAIDIHIQKQLNTPTFPYFIKLNVNTPMAHNEVKTQKIII